VRGVAQACDELHYPYVDIDSFFETRECLSSFQSREYDRTDFDGSTYEVLSQSWVETQFWAVHDEGHAKEERVVDKEGEIIWRETLRDKFFNIETTVTEVDEESGQTVEKQIRYGWLEEPTRALIITVNFINLSMQVLL
jgi:hypothetical protein